MIRARGAVVLVVWMLAPLAAPASAGPPDWNAVADVRTVQVVTTDADGSPRDTKVWLAVVDGQGYIRTGGTTWGDNVVRNPDVTLRFEDGEHPLRVEFVEDEAERERIVAAFRAKYGFTDRMLSFMRGSRPRIMRLLPRD
jgi:hypothetical protein